MAVYLSDLIDELRLLLVDPSDTTYAFTTKRLFLNRGINAMFPRIYRTVSDITTLLVLDQYEYTLPTAIAGGLISQVEMETEPASDIYNRLDEYQLLHTGSGVQRIVLPTAPESDMVGAQLRFTAAMPITAFAAASYAAAGSEAYNGPPHTHEIPVAYAMSLCYMTALNPRMDFGEYSVQNQNGAADIVGIMGAGQYWMEQFRLLLDQHEMPLPISVV